MVQRGDYPHLKLIETHPDLPDELFRSVVWPSTQSPQFDYNVILCGCSFRSRHLFLLRRSVKLRSIVEPIFSGIHRVPIWVAPDPSILVICEPVPIVALDYLHVPVLAYKQKSGIADVLFWVSKPERKDYRDSIPDLTGRSPKWPGKNFGFVLNESKNDRMNSRLFKRRDFFFRCFILIWITKFQMYNYDS